MRRGLDRLAARVSQLFSSVWAALVAVLLAAVWTAAAFGGGLAGTWHFPNAWESVLVVVAHLVTFVMLFFIQSTQERNTRAIQLKLDELLRAVEGARDSRLVGVEEKSSDELDRTGQQLTDEPHPTAEDRPA